MERNVRSLLLLLLTLAIVVAPASTASDQRLPHVNPVHAKVAPGSSVHFHIDFEEGDLREDWVFVLNTVARNGSEPLKFALRDETGAAGEWSVPTDGSTQYLTTRIQRTAAHELVVENPGTQEALATFFYDASCNCDGKPVPPDVDQGAVLFHVDAKKGDRMRTLFPEPALLNLTVVHALRSEEASRWPQDFRALGSSEQPTTENGRQTHVLEWKAGKDERHYFWVTAVDTDRARFFALPPESAVFGVYIDPTHERLGGESPQPLVLLQIAAALVGARLASRHVPK